jgi:putative thioredoxin
MEINIKAKVVEVNRENFEKVVIEGSKKAVVVVDFWAPWCAPCRTLGPVLEEVVAELGPGLVLAKVNVDENQELAMAFRVQGIPAVKIVRDGKLVQEFSGALPKEQVKAILAPLAPKLTDDDEQEPADQAGQLAARGDLKGAARIYERTLEKQPDNSRVRFELARVRLRQGQFKTIQELIEPITEEHPEYQPARALLTFVELARIAEASKGRSACARQMLADPDDLEARYGFACCAAIEGDYENALKEWLTLVERRKDFRNGAAREAMVAVFHLLGRENQLVNQYQRRLYQALY